MTGGFTEVLSLADFDDWSEWVVALKLRTAWQLTPASSTRIVHKLILVAHGQDNGVVVQDSDLLNQRLSTTAQLDH